MSIRTKDTVQILTGRDRGKKGRVLQVLPKAGRVVVEGMNLLVKHARAKRQRQKGERVQFASPLALANVQLVCPHCTKPTRVRFHETGGKKERICRRCQSPIR